MTDDAGGIRRGTDHVDAWDDPEGCRVSALGFTLHCVTAPPPQPHRWGSDEAESRPTGRSPFAIHPVILWQTAEKVKKSR